MVKLTLCILAVEQIINKKTNKAFHTHTEFTGPGFEQQCQWQDTTDEMELRY